MNKQKTAESEARRYLKEGRVNKVIELAKKILNESPEDEKIRALLGLAYLRNGRYEEGMAECREALKINPNYVEAYITLGKGALRKGDYKEAIRALTKALELEPDNKEVLPQSGKNLVIRASLVEGASEARPHNKEAHYQLGLVYDHLGMAEKAKEEYRKVYQEVKRDEVFKETIPKEGKKRSKKSRKT